MSFDYEWDYDLEQRWEDRHGYPEQQDRDANILDFEEDFGDYDCSERDEDEDEEEDEDESYD